MIYRVYGIESLCYMEAVCVDVTVFDFSIKFQSVWIVDILLCKVELIGSNLLGNITLERKAVCPE